MPDATLGGRWCSLLQTTDLAWFIKGWNLQVPVAIVALEICLPVLEGIFQNKHTISHSGIFPHLCCNMQTPGRRCLLGPRNKTLPESQKSCHKTTYTVPGCQMQFYLFPNHTHLYCYYSRPSVMEESRLLHWISTLKMHYNSLYDAYYFMPNTSSNSLHVFIMQHADQRLKGVSQLMTGPSPMAPGGQCCCCCNLQAN